jgi:hypothetical protein
VGKLSFLLLVLIASAIVAVSALLFPSMLSDLGFWLNVSWILFLAFLNWAASTFLFLKVSDAGKNPLFGVLPGLNIVVFLYSVVSAGLLSANIYNQNFLLLANWHLVVQIIIGLICFSIVILMLIASKGAEIPLGPEGIENKELLLRRMARLKNELDEEFEPDISSLIEQLKFSVPHITKLNSLEDYQKFCQLVYDLEDDNLDTNSVPNLVGELKKIVKYC